MNSIQSTAEQMFVEDGLTAKEIATKLNKAENTIGKWRKAGKWDDKKDQFSATPYLLKKLILEDIQRVADGEKPKINPDDLSKLTRALERVDKKVSVQMIYSCLKEVDLWCAMQDMPLKDLEMILDYHGKFLTHRIEQEA